MPGPVSRPTYPLPFLSPMSLTPRPPVTAGRRCPAAGCPVILTRGERYCPAHLQGYQARRGTRQARGYGIEHEQERARVAAIVNLGKTRCARCGQLIRPAQPWALDHTDDRTGYLGASHKRCNDEAGGKAAHDEERRRGF